MKTINKLIITSIVLLTMFVLPYAGIKPGIARAATSGSLLFAYDYDGGGDPDCWTAQDFCVYWGDGVDADAAPSQWNFCLAKAEQYAVGTDNPANYNFDVQPLSPVLRLEAKDVCSNSPYTGESDFTYTIYNVSFSPKPPPPSPLSLIDSSAPSTAYLGDSFQIKCNFGTNDLPCITSTHGGKSCSFAGMQGNYAVFNCLATQLGLQSNSCNIFSHPQDPRCTPVQADPIQNTNVLNRCTSHSTKQCSGNAVYWYDSCGVKQDVYQQCTGNQTCSNGSCTAVACSSNTQCGTNGLTGSPFCQSNNVYQNYTTYTCNNPGTASSSCSSSNVAQLQTTCSGSQTCSNGSCTAVSCSSNSQCGTNGLTGSLFCQSNNVYQNYTTYTCNNPGTASSSCTNSVTAQLQTTCSGNQTCSSGSCSNVNNCTQNSQERCNGNNLYWYDSCGNQGSLIQYCPNGCNGNSCGNNNTCSYHSYERCLGNNLYWFDSCGTQQDLAQYCQNGCYNNSCGNNYNNGTLNVNKTVRNITAGNSGFSGSTYANPLDMVLFMITLQASGQDVQNVFVRDTLPTNLIYANQLVVACTTNTGNYNNNYNNNCNNNIYNYSGNIVSGINLNTIYAGQMVTITYQAQVANAANFSYGTTTLTNNVSVTSSNTGYTPSTNASVVVTRGAVLGASTVSTGLTNNFWLDSFFLPLIITLIGIWMLRSGMFFGVEKWLDGKKKIRRGYKVQKELSKKIELIKKEGKV